jgi:PKD repeat protein
VAVASPTFGLLPLTVQFDGSASTGTGLAYAWDLDGDGQFDDSTAVAPSLVFSVAGNYVVRLRVTDDDGVAAVSAPLTISAGNTPPSPVIATPPAGLTWRVGDVIAFSGSATDTQDGPLAAARLHWRLIVQHCPSNCHEHVVQEFPGVASGSFPAPDHGYPSYLELRLTATDSAGLAATASVDLLPRTVSLRFETSFPGLQLSVNAASAATPFSRDVIVGSSNSLAAPPSQTLGPTRYTFGSWAHGGPAAQQLTAPESPATYRAEYQVATSFRALSPCRVVDTRTAGGPIAGGSERVLTLAGACGIPPTARAVSLNVTVTQPTAAGFVSLRAAGTAVPTTSTVNYVAQQTRANSALVALGPGGQVAVACGQAAGTVQVILDVNGYFE